MKLRAPIAPLRMAALAVFVTAAAFGTVWLRPAAASNIYNVKSAPFNARCDGQADDARAIQAAERAAANAGGGAVYIPAGKCKISTGIQWDSNVSLQGAGMHQTTLVATPNFGFEDKHVRFGENGRFIGMIWLDGPTATSPLRNVTISNIGFDPRAGTQSFADDPTGKGTYQCITANQRPLQHVKFENLYFDMGANNHEVVPGEANGSKGFFGIVLTVLGVDPNNPSHDLSFININGHNGNGTIQLALGGRTNRQGVTSRAYNISIDGVHDNVDVNYILDDRVVIDGGTLGSRLGQISNITIRNVSTYISDNVSVGSANAVKINPATNTIIYDVTIDGIAFHGSANGAWGAPLPNSNSKNGSGTPLAIAAYPQNGFVRNVTIRNIMGVNSQGILVGVGSEAGQITNTVIDNVTLLNCYAPLGAVAIAAAGPNTGNDHFELSNFRIVASPVALAHGRPAGLYFTAQRGAGVGGSLVVHNGSIEGYPRPVLVRSPGFDGLQIQGVRWTTGRPEIHYSNVIIQ